MKKIAIALIKTYRIFISPLLTAVFGRGCKYELTCSQYSLEAFNKYNFSKALNLSLRRLLSCHSFR